jgi:hypothetical protein
MMKNLLRVFGWRVGLAAVFTIAAFALMQPLTAWTGVPEVANVLPALAVMFWIEISLLIGRKILSPKIDQQEIMTAAVTHEPHGATAVSVLLVGQQLFRLAVLVAIIYFAPTARAADAPTKPLPGDAAMLLPMLKIEMQKYWPAVTPRAWIPALIEQESLWRVNAKLKTAREHGCGLGQFTIAYRADGSARFDALAETRALDASLAGWSWRDCANAEMQLRAVVLKLKTLDRQCEPLMAGNRNTKACAGASYNGGFGSVTKRIRACAAAANCNPGVWAANLDQHCPQARVRVAGYGESFCDINSKYPAKIEARMPKYTAVM